ncbi:MAG: hypothetical protein KME18_18865 [Phormidium tanganyikae FI6-MK23]|jgi:hypothetical protein|nr:hypothetical protein [Phormidium tanganyikae FI6-MK23]
MKTLQITLTLAMMSQLLVARGEFETAIVNLRESIDILQRIGSPDAATVIDILNSVIELQNREAQD